MSYGDRRSEPLPMPTDGWMLMHGAVWFADLVIVAFLAMPLVAPTSFFDPMWDPASSLLGVPAAFLLHVVGLGLAVIGRLWMERILRANREPDAHDEFWWSRA